LISFGVTLYKNFKIIIPTRDSSKWLHIIIDYYRRHNIDPLFIVDTRTIDNTRNIIARADLKYLEFTPRGDFPEAGMIQFGAENASTEWVIRIDDDELPSINLLNWVEQIGSRSRNQCWFISRKELFRRGDDVFYSRSIGKYPIPNFQNKLHPMARLFHIHRVKFQEELHTSGFEELNLFNFAPDDCFIIHLNCLIHTMLVRLNKIKFYEKLKPGSTWQLSDEYLPELFTPEFHNESSNNISEFQDIFEKLSPLYGQETTIPDLDRMHAVKEVKNRAHAILKARVPFLHSSIYPLKHYDADNFRWVDWIPRPLQFPVAQLFCTLMPKHKKTYGAALWDYIASIQNDKFY